MSDTVEFDKTRAKAFQANIVGIMNGGALALMISLGHKTGLFDSMDGKPARTAVAIAEDAGLHERYVREWLSAMACGAIVDFDPATDTFALPVEHAGLLTRRAGPLNLSTQCQYVALLGEVEDEIAEAFRSGGGVPYDRYPRFQALMAESSGQRYERTLIDQVVPILPVGQALEAGIDVADVGCGSGKAMRIFAAAFPASRFVGFDISEDAITVARAEAASAGLTNLSFEVADAAALDQVDRFDFVTTFDAIHDQAHPDTVLAGIYRMLRSGGTYLCVEPKSSSELADNIDEPMSAFMYSVSTMHCMTVSLAYGGEGLGTAWGHQTAVERLTSAGFSDIEVTGVRDDRSNSYFLSTKPA
ncbi:methyltransferase domain-containing protein [Acidimicrobiales bacterium]|jgi:ubiquinone/menaquinone biosynthesis C-methylase UbiE|nr:methyltransferase domain-containing protein [bacterium]MDB9845467.1 methyltransferase domain-containing protein [Acidimicrobiales bacterium]